MISGIFNPKYKFVVCVFKKKGRLHSYLIYFIWLQWPENLAEINSKYPYVRQIFC